MKNRKMKKFMKRLRLAVLFVLVWVILPTVLYLAVDIWIFRRPLDAYTLAHSAACALGLGIGVFLCKAAGWAWKKMKRFWKKYAIPGLTMIGGIMAGMEEQHEGQD